MPLNVKEQYMKKTISLLLGAALISANVILPVSAGAQESTDKLNIHDPVINYEEGTVTVSGYITDFVYNKYDPVTINLIVTDGTDYGTFKTDLSGLVYLNEISVGKDGKFELVYEDGLKEGEHVVNRTLFFTNPYSGERKTADYMLSDGTGFDEVLNAQLLAEVGSPVYYVNGTLYESSKAAYSQNGNVYLPKEMLDNAKISYTADGGFVNADAISGDKYISQSTGLVVIGKSDCAEFDNTIVGTMFGVYVTTEGDDNNNGTVNKPVKSIERAVELSEQAKIKHKTVYVKGGEYITSGTIALDSGNRGLTIKALCGEKVTVRRNSFIPKESFGTADDNAISSLKFPASVKGKLMVTDLSAYDLVKIADTQKNEYSSTNYEIPRYYHVYQDGIMQTLAKWPNGEKFSNYSQSSEKGSFDDVEKLTLWSGAKDAYTYSCAGSGYDVSRNLITGIDMDKKQFIVADNSRAYPGGRFFVYNMPQELDVPGEWYIDYDTKKLYYYPIDGFDGIDFVSEDKPFVTINGTSGITLDGIDFEYTRENAINLDNSANVTICNSTIHGITGTAVYARHANNLTVRNCEMYDLGLGGVKMWQDGKDDNAVPCNNKVTNCHIYDFSVNMNTNQYGIYSNGPGAEISNNTVHGANHIGIAFAGSDVTVSGNEVYEVGRETGDAGGIHCGGTYTQQGIKIDRNFLHDIDYYIFSVYCDDRISGVEVTNNIFKDTNWIGQFSSGRNNTFSGNLVINSGYLNYTNDAANGGWRSPSKKFIQITVLDKIADGTIKESAWRANYRGFGEFLDEIKKANKDNDFLELSFDNNQTFDTYYKTLGLPKNFIYENNTFVKTDDYERRTNHFDSGYAKDSTETHLSKDAGVRKYSDRIQEETLLTSIPEYDTSSIGSTLESTVTAPRAVYPKNNDSLESGSFTAVWNKAHGINKYRLTIADNADFNNPVVDKVVYYNYYDVEGLANGNYFAKITALDQRQQCYDEAETTVAFSVGENETERTVTENEDGSLTVSFTSALGITNPINIIVAGKNSSGILTDTKLFEITPENSKAWSQTVSVEGDIKEVYVWEKGTMTPKFEKWSNKK